MANHILLDDKFYISSQPIIPHNNIGFLSGLFFSFEIIGDSSYLFFPNGTYSFFCEKCSSFNFNYKISQSVFEQSLFHLLRKNRIYRGFKGIITAYKTNNNFSTVISVEENENEFYKLNNNCELTISESNVLPKIILESKKYPFINFSSLFEESNENDIILLDENKNIISTINSNILFINEEAKIIIPKKRTENGNKIILDYFINLCKKNQIIVKEEDINFNFMQKMEECFLLNGNTGITWVKKIKKEKFFFHKNIDKLAKLLNEEIKSEIDLKKANV